jgi:hypothetical protein
VHACNNELEVCIERSTRSHGPEYHQFAVQPKLLAKN